MITFINQFFHFGMILERISPKSGVRCLNGKVKLEPVAIKQDKILDKSYYEEDEIFDVYRIKVGSFLVNLLT